MYSRYVYHIHHLSFAYFLYFEHNARRSFLFLFSPVCSGGWLVAATRPVHDVCGLWIDEKKTQHGTGWENEKSTPMSPSSERINTKILIQMLRLVLKIDSSVNRINIKKRIGFSLLRCTYLYFILFQRVATDSSCFSWESNPGLTGGR